ncbi:MAG TPA: DUF3043 domain-containing protein [Kineosporiaceae bacterium]|nr:DUF3043 domain-containing protein [Kineosporiaceae bacterium]
MFGRDKTSAPPASTPAARNATSERVKEGGKGRATPTRREAELRNRRPVVGAPPPPRGATRAERKIQRNERRTAAREARIRGRVALANGDERALPSRDKGPVRKFVRDYVDARRNLGEFFMPVALVSLAIGFIGVEQARVLSLILLYLMVIAIAVDSFLLSRRLKRVTQAKFGDKGTAGSGAYGVMRALQLRRMRMPKPQVERGQYPPS